MTINIQKLSNTEQSSPKPIQSLPLHRNWVSSILIGLIGEEDCIITASEDCQILLTTFQKGTHSIANHQKPINHLAFNADKTLFLACSDDGCIYLYETKGFKEIVKVEGFDETGIRKACFGINRKIIAACNSGQMGIYDLRTAKLEIFDTHTATVDAIAVHPTKPLALTNDMHGNMMIWDLTTNTIVHTLTEARGIFVKGIDHFGANYALWTDEYIIIGQDEILIFDTNYKLLHTIKGLPSPPTALCLDKQILWATGNSIIAWDLKTLEKRCSLPQKNRIYALAFDTQKRQLLAGHRNGQLKQWQMDNLLSDNETIRHAGKVQFHTQGKQYIATSASDKSIIIWTKEGKAVYQYFSDDNWIAVIQFQHTYRLLFIENGALKVLDVLTKEVEIIQLISEKFPTQSIAIFDNVAVLTGISRYPRLLDLNTYDITPLRFKFALYECSNQMKGKIAITGYLTEPEEFHRSYDIRPLEAPVAIYDFQKNAYIKELWLDGTKGFGDYWNEPSFYPTTCAYEEDQLVVGYSNGNIAIWNVEEGTIIHQIRPSNTYIRLISKLPNGNYLVNDNRIYALNAALKPVLSSDLGSDLVVRLLDADLELILAYSIRKKHIYFIDMNTLEARFTAPISGLVDAIIKSGDYYFVFTNNGMEYFYNNY